MESLAESCIGYKPWLLHTNTGKMISSLLQTPLFLSMYLPVLKDQLADEHWDQRIFEPKNVAHIIDLYVNHLLSAYLKAKGIEDSGALSVPSMKKILTQFARQAFENPIDDPNIDEAIFAVAASADLAIVKRALYGSNIIVDEDGITRFQFETLNVYFYSLFLLQSQDKVLQNYVEQNINDETIEDIVIYMVGTTKRKKQQDLILDYLEQFNLPLYAKCLRQRYRYTIKSVTEKSCHDLFEQMRQSYLNIIQYHFSALRRYFEPWRNYTFDESCDIKKLLVGINGSLNASSLGLVLEWVLRNNSGDAVPLNVEFITDDSRPSLLTEDKKQSRFPTHEQICQRVSSCCLSMRYGGIDCAREIALQTVLDGLKEILEGDDLLPTEHQLMKVEFLESCLDVLPRKANGEKISLRRDSLRDIEAILQPMRDEVHYKSFNRSQFISPAIIKNTISQISGDKLDLSAILPPEGRAMPSERGSWTWAERYPLDIMKKRIIWHFDAIQTCYRYFVEEAFPTLKDQMPLYCSGPVQYRITIYIDDGDLGPAPNDRVEITWVPVKASDERQTEITVCLEKETKETWSDKFIRLKEISAQLKLLGRNSN